MVYRFIARYQSLTHRLASLLPSECLLCGARTPELTDFCDACQAELPWLPPGCRRCAIPLPDADHTELCGQCLIHPPSFSRTEACWLYRPPVANLIARFKYQRTLAYGRSLSVIMASQLVSAYTGDNFPDLVTAVPLHRWRLWRRGFNQSEAIARQLARELSLPYQNLLTRHRATRSQQSLDARQRKRNLKQAFGSQQRLNGECIALVDDVMTTGATADELSRTLLRAGASEVHIWCLARTPTGG